MPEKLTQGVIEGWASQTVGWWKVSQMDDDLEIGSREGKSTRRVSLLRLVAAGKLEKHRFEEGKYRYIRQDIHKLNPAADPGAVIPLKFPRDIQTDEHFQLDNIKIFPKSVLICAGVSNNCKTAFLLNVLVENMEIYHCMYMTNELSDEEFVDRMAAFDWVKCKNGNGEWKFDAVEHYQNYHDIVQPDAINIIDYLDPGENPYFIGPLIDQIRQKLNKGIAIIAIQKGVSTWVDKQGKKQYSYREYGTGGQYSEHRARLVLHFDPTGDISQPYLLTIKKAKMYSMVGRKFKFNLFQGSKFQNIQEVTDEKA